MTATPRRFYIEMPVESLNAEQGKLYVDPLPRADCQIAFWPASGGKPARFPGKLYTARLPGVPLKYLAYKVDTELFEFVGRWTEGSFSSKENLELTPHAWATFYRALKILPQPHARVEVAIDSDVPLRMTLGPAADSDEDDHAYMEALSEYVARTMDLCGAHHERFRSEAIYEARATTSRR